MVFWYLNVITDPLKFYTACGDKNENSILRAKAAPPEMNGVCPALLEAGDVHMSHFDSSQLGSSVTHFLSLFGQECSDRC